MDTVAIVPGSFDPVTAGHVDIIRRAARIFGKVYAAVMDNPDKSYLFPAAERLKLLRDAVKDIENVSTEYYSGFLYEYARQKGAYAIVKGARTGVDFEYEMEMAAFNRLHFPEAETLLLCAGDGLEGVSSSVVREKARRGESLDGLVTPMCAQALAHAFSKK